MNKRAIFTIIFLSSLLFFSCIKKREIKVESDKTIVENIIRECVLALDSADTDKLLSFYAKNPEVIVIGSEDGFQKGPERVEKFYKGFIKALSKEGKKSLVLSELETRIIDGVAWFSSRLVLGLEQKVKTKNRTKVKLIERKLLFSGVLVKEEGNWKLVQSHLSLPSI
jgi:ketosteroid isomerase-like protein